jgi:hypothetical protein
VILASSATDIAAIVVALVAVATFVMSLINRRTLLNVHDEVKTTNGLTLAALGDRAEGRRIQSDVAHADRTASEQHYVEQLNDPTINPGE